MYILFLQQQFSHVNSLLQCHFDPTLISQDDLLKILVDTEVSLPDELTDMEIPGRCFTFPIVLDDSWSQDAINHYMKTTRDKAVYLPSNIDYLAKNNGLDGPQQALQKLVESNHVSWNFTDSGRCLLS